MPPLRLAVVGCGAAARSCHLTALPNVPQIRLTALIDPDPEQARATLKGTRTRAVPPRTC